MPENERDAPDDRQVLVVEDEEHLASGLKLNFEMEGFGVDVAGSAREAGTYLVRENAYDVILLDVMLPDVDGFELCQRLRDAGNFTPVIMLTVRRTAEDRVTGLEVGADDYLTKPFEFSELLARVESLLRRRRWERKESEDEPAVLSFGQARVNFDAHEIEVDGEPLELTRLELDLLRYFARHPGRVLSRKELLENVWKLRNYPNTRTVDNFIVRLRKYFEPEPSRPIFFVSVRGAGYKFLPTADRED